MKKSTLTIILLALLTWPAGPARADWPQQGFDSQRSSFNPNENVLGKNNVGELQVLWTNSVPCTINNGPTTANGIVYYGHYCGEFRAVDADTGATIWTQSINRTETGNAVVDGIVYVTARCTYDSCGMAYAFNATTGVKRWSWDPGPRQVQDPVVSDGVVYVTTKTDSNVYGIQALDANTGNEIWNVSLGNKTAVANGVVYTTTSGSNPNSLLALDAGNGDLLWTGPIDGSYVLSRPTVSNPFVYVRSSDGYLYAFNANGCGDDECLPLWKGPVSIDSYNSPQPPAVAGGKVYVGAGNSFYAFDASGCGDSQCLPLWTTNTACSFFRNIVNSPSIANGVVYSTCDKNYIYAFDALTGEILWQYYTPAGYGMRASPAIANGRLFHAATFNFTLYAFEPPYANHPPYTPSDPSPIDGATDVDFEVDLSWAGGDPDPGDIVTYDVYFGMSTPPPIVSSGQSENAYDPGPLSSNTMYYWKIVAKDNYDAETEGPVWSFTTEGWRIAYDSLLESQSDLEVLRDYRDQSLTQTAKGKFYTTLLYNNSGKVLAVLLDNPELMLEANALIQTNIEAVSEVLNGYEGIIYNTDEIVAFLGAYAKKSPPILKILAYIVRWDILRIQRRGDLFFGFRLK